MILPEKNIKRLINVKKIISNLNNKSILICFSSICLKDAEIWQKLKGNKSSIELLNFINKMQLTLLNKNYIQVYVLFYI